MSPGLSTDWEMDGGDAEIDEVDGEDADLGLDSVGSSSDPKWPCGLH